MLFNPKENYKPKMCKNSMPKIVQNSYKKEIHSSISSRQFDRAQFDQTYFWDQLKLGKLFAIAS